MAFCDRQEADALEGRVPKTDHTVQLCAIEIGMLPISQQTGCFAPFQTIILGHIKSTEKPMKS